MLGILITLSIAVIVLLVLLLQKQNRLANAREREQTLKQEVEQLRREYAPILDIEAAVDERKKQIEAAKGEWERLQQTIVDGRTNWQTQYEQLIAEYKDLNSRVVHIRDLAEMQEFGVYEPIFDFDTSERYKVALKAIRDKQKELIKAEKATICDTKWTVSGSEAKGRDMVKRLSKLQLRAFNGECDAAVAKARFDNVVQLRERITKSQEAINVLGKANDVRISSEYLRLKVDELNLAYELAKKVEAEREEQRAIRAQMREEEEAQKEIERAKLEAEKEEIRYAQALEKARKELDTVQDSKQEALRKKIALLEKQFEEAHEKKARAISRAQLTKSGHIYIISNIGSFGDDVFKIGMTRRLEPLDRVVELGGASVPFRFDVHAMIYSEDAPTLENQLHRKFTQKQINRVNPRREFFRVTLDEIEAAVTELCGQKAEVVRTAVAEEFRESEALRKKEEAARLAQQEIHVRTEVDRAKELLEGLREKWKAEPVA